MAPADPGRDRLLTEQASSFLWAGRIADAETACRSLLNRDHDRSVEDAVRICLGHALLSAGRARDSICELERACQSPVLTGPERASAQGWASVARLRLLDLDGAAAAAGEARSAAVSARDHAAASMAMGSLALVSESRGHLRDALQIADDAVRLADESPGRLGHRYPIHIPRGYILVALDRLDEARSTIETGRRISEELGIRWSFASYHAVRAFERFLAGHWDDAIAEIEAGAGLASETGHSYSFILGRGVLSLIRLHRNDLPGARDAAGVTAAQLSDVGSRQRGNWSAWAHALVLEADGDTAQALATLAGCWDRCASCGLAVEYPVIGPDLVRLALAAGDADRARDVAAAVTGVASCNEVPWIAGAALRCQGLAESDAEMLQAAAGRVRLSWRSPARTRAPRSRHRATWTAPGSSSIKRSPSSSASVPHVILPGPRPRCGRWVSAAGRRVSHSRAQSGWQSLTPSERAVVDLVAEGLSNPQIGQRLYVSRRTVQTHLGHVFAKLHITSRTQLAAEAIQHRG